MVCEICHKREATVHLNSCTAGEAAVAHWNFCQVCFPFESMSKEEKEAAFRRLLNMPPGDKGGEPAEGL